MARDINFVKLVDDAYTNPVSSIETVSESASAIGYELGTILGLIVFVVAFCLFLVLVSKLSFNWLKNR